MPDAQSTRMRQRRPYGNQSRQHDAATHFLRMFAIHAASCCQGRVAGLGPRVHHAGHGRWSWCASGGSDVRRVTPSTSVQLWPQWQPIWTPAKTMTSISSRSRRRASPPRGPAGCRDRLPARLSAPAGCNRPRSMAEQPDRPTRNAAFSPTPVDAPLRFAQRVSRTRGNTWHWSRAGRVRSKRTAIRA